MARARPAQRWARDARRVKAALQMRLNKTDENDAEGWRRCCARRRRLHDPLPAKTSTLKVFPVTTCITRGHSARRPLTAELWNGPPLLLAALRWLANQGRGQ